MADWWAFLSDENNRGAVTVIVAVVVAVIGGLYKLVTDWRRKPETPTAPASPQQTAGGGIATTGSIRAENIFIGVGPGGMDVSGNRVLLRDGQAAQDSAIPALQALSPDHLVELVRLSASPEAGDRAALLARLDELIPETSRMRAQAMARLIEILDEKEISAERLPDRFAEIVQENLTLRDHVRALRVNDNAVQSLREAAAEALDNADHDTARAKLQEARALVREKRETVADALAGHQRQEAALLAEQAGVERARLAYREAASLFEEAAGLLPAEDRDGRWRHLLDAAGTWYAHGLEFGDNEALVRAISVHQEAIDLAPRSDHPRDWATTQNNLGAALQALGERESGTERLEQAVTAYRAALEECTRESVPLDWAMTQNNLGNALWALGKRESGTERLEQAVAAFRAALEEHTRERVPLDWATTQNNLGNALWALGQRESGTERLEQAVAAYRAALEERTRERVPLDWATTQNNLGAALRNLGRRQSGTDRLEQAVAAFRAALEERTRERVPLAWAMTQNNLGKALQTLGERAGKPTLLRDALAATRDSRDVYVDEAGLTQYAAGFQSRIAELERLIAEMEGR